MSVTFNIDIDNNMKELGFEPRRTKQTPKFEPHQAVGRNWHFDILFGLNTVGLFERPVLPT
jgi:hypothetical protein